MCSGKRGKHLNDYILIFIINLFVVYKIKSVESKSHKRKLSERYSHVELDNMSMISQVVGWFLHRFLNARVRVLFGDLFFPHSLEHCHQTYFSGFI